MLTLCTHYIVFILRNYCTLYILYIFYMDLKRKINFNVYVTIVYCLFYVIIVYYFIFRYLAGCWFGCIVWCHHWIGSFGFSIVYYLKVSYLVNPNTLEFDVFCKFNILSIICKTKYATKKAQLSFDNF